MVRVRFAPSPTGYLHVGGARTALYCHLFAKHHGGQFILRAEDTDVERSSEDYLRVQLSSLEWLGYEFQEGIDPKTLKDFGPLCPYRQSQRLSIYKEHADRLLQSGQAYYCFLTDEEIEKQRAESIAAGRPPQVNSPYRNWTLSDAQKKLAEGATAVVRFKVPDLTREYVFTDIVRGEVKFPSDMVGDFVLLRSGGMPVYNFCCVIDDALMKITHVLRAEEHLSNTLRQLMLYEAFKYKVPEFGHLSIILGGDRQKLSKRHGATSVHEYQERGFLPEALNNFVALLGWSAASGQEIMSMKEMIEQFSADRFHSAAAVFDEAKLKWMNAQHLRALPHAELWNRILPFLTKAGLRFSANAEWQSRTLEVMKTSMETLADAVELLRPLSHDVPTLTPEGRETMAWPKSVGVVNAWIQKLKEHGSETISEAEFIQIQEGVKAQCQVKGKELFMPIRVAVLGKPHGAELKVLIPLMERSLLVERAGQIVNQLN